MARKKTRGDESPASPSAPAVVRLPDALTIHGVRDVKASLLQCLEQPHLVIDLQSVREVDTAGVQLLLAVRRTRLGAGATLRWQGGPGVVSVAARALGLADELALAGEA
jgi:anti-anti-sigma regulatory factor